MSTILVWVLAGIVWSNSANVMPTFPSTDLAGCERQKAAITRAGSGMLNSPGSTLQCVQVSVPVEALRTLR